jgi:hypothetical protein
MHTARGQVIKTFKPAPPSNAANNLPVPPGFGRVELWKKNKPSKKRVKVNPNEFIKNMEDLNQMQYSDKGGDGGD